MLGLQTGNCFCDKGGVAPFVAPSSFANQLRQLLQSFHDIASVVSLRGLEWLLLLGHDV